MREEVLSLIERLEKETGLSREKIVELLSSAIRMAAVKKFGGKKEVEVKFDAQTGDIEVKVGDKPIPLSSLGRMVAFHTRQLIAQKIKEEERNLLIEKFSSLKGKIIQGIVDRKEGRDYVLDVEGMEVVLNRRETLPQDDFYRGERIKVLVLDVDEKRDNPVILSRTHPQFLEKLLEEEVIELKEGTVEIKKVVREAGYRSKVAVVSKRKEVDSVGALVGIKASRIKGALHELRGEKVDIIPYSEDIREYISRALSPAEVEDIEIFPEDKRARVIVRDDQLSLAIGRKGQNVSLAARLTGWNIDVRPLSQAMKEREISPEEREKEFMSIPGIDEEKAKRLVKAGFFSVEDISRVPREELAKLLKIETETAQKIINSAREMLKGVKVG